MGTLLFALDKRLTVGGGKHFLLSGRISFVFFYHRLTFKDTLLDLQRHKIAYSKNKDVTGVNKGRKRYDFGKDKI